MGEPDRAVFARGFRAVCGVDEVGRGPLAGPVVAAAVLLDRDAAPLLPGLGDSKALSSRTRADLVPRIHDVAIGVGVGLATVEEIDRLNILQASLLAMARAVASLSSPPDFLLVDGLHPIPLPIPQETLVKGDARSVCIAAASNVAKEHRDRLMCEYAVLHPGYGFDEHKGYPTASHREALRRLGPSPLHRLTFRGVRELLAPPAQPDLFRAL
ncbi:MAG: ribonuclease HII [Deltaproteobacteria bacterium]|nr:ribonuclease HII [Deltaproteobacteria bacterium]